MNKTFVIIHKGVNFYNLEMAFIGLYTLMLNLQVVEDVLLHVVTIYGVIIMWLNL